MHGVVFTRVFERHARDAGLSESEIMAIAVELSENPLAGDLMLGTGGARKVRFARQGKGKSGGFRTVHYFGGVDVPIFVLALIDKGKRSDLSQAERNELSRLLPRLREAYRGGVHARAKRLGERR
jgi:hypothetical protein